MMLEIFLMLIYLTCCTVLEFFFFWQIIELSTLVVGNDSCLNVQAT